MTRHDAADKRPVRQLFAVKLALLIFVLGLFFTGRSIRPWPIQTWPMYGRYAPSFPGDRHSVREIVVIDHEGSAHAIQPMEFFGLERDNIGEYLIRDAFEHESPEVRATSRRYLIDEIGAMRPEVEIAALESWRLTFAVKPLEFPPLDRDAPVERELLGRFDVAPQARR